MRSLILSICFLVLLQACTNGSGRKAPITLTPRDTTISPEIAYADIFFDSTRLESYIRQHQLTDSNALLMRSFYNGRNYQVAWFTRQGKLTDQALAFWNLHDQHSRLTGDSSAFDKDLHVLVDRLVEEDSALPPRGTSLLAVELGLTEHFFVFARYAYDGRLDPRDLEWYIPKKKVNALALLDSLVNTSAPNLDKWEPVNPMYARVRNELKRYYEIQSQGPYDSLRMAKGRKLALGDSGVLVRQLRKRLSLLGDLDDTDTLSARFDAQMESGVRRAQERFGFTINGVIDQRLLDQLNTPPVRRIEQLLVNMERMRWVPRQRTGAAIVVNIPEFRMHVYADTGKVFDMKIVVGKSATRTVVFNDELRYVVFSPYWNVPASIVRNEILPAMQRNPGYLARKNMEQTGTSGGLPVIRQKPGGSNSLGLVKFLFPNSYNIYFHDTPVKSTFNRDKRDASHGCIRLSEPVRLARWLLRDQPEWTPEKIAAAMHQDKEKWVTVTKPVPVFISYFTAWVDGNGLLHFRDDIYGHDAAMAKRLFSN